MKTYYLNFFFWKNPTLRRSRKNAPRNSMSFAGLFDLYFFCAECWKVSEENIAFFLLIVALMRNILCADVHLQYLFTTMLSIYIYVTCDLHLCNPQHQELKTFKHAAGRCIEEYFVSNNAEEAGNTSADWFISLGVNHVILTWLLWIIIHSYSP